MLTIVTPTLNSIEFIEKNIKSIKELTIPFEHIVVDGGSTDGTLELINNYAHIKLLHQTEPLGMYHAIQMGFNESDSKFITWINSDDWVLKEGYEKLYKLISLGKNDLVYGSSKYYFLSDNRYQIQNAKPYGKFLLKNGVFPFIQPSSMYTKSIYNEIKGLNFNQFKLIGDIDFFMRLSIATKKQINYITDECVVFLKYGESLGDRNHDKYLIEKKNLLLPAHGKLGVMLSKFIYKLHQ